MQGSSLVYCLFGIFLVHRGRTGVVNTEQQTHDSVSPAEPPEFHYYGSQDQDATVGTNPLPPAAAPLLPMLQPIPSPQLFNQANLLQLFSQQATLSQLLSNQATLPQPVSPHSTLSHLFPPQATLPQHLAPQATNSERLAKHATLSSRSGRSGKQATPVKVEVIQRLGKQATGVGAASGLSSRECCNAQFHCGSGHCIPDMWVCDEQADCWDGSDERNCGPVMCSRSQFTCTSGNCIVAAWQCDGDNDCGDWSDENNCGTPPPRCPGQFECGNGNCIDAARECDGENDCGDWGDERACTGIRKSRNSRHNGQPFSLQALLSLPNFQPNISPSPANILNPWFTHHNSLANTHPTTLDIFLGQTTLSLTSLTRTLNSTRPLAAADVVILTSFLTQVARNLILQGHSDPTSSALFNFLLQVVSSLCPSAPTCTSLAPSTEAPTNTALASFTASAALQPTSHHLALINTLNSATVAMATSTSATPGAGFASFLTVLAQRFNSLGSTGLASFIAQLALTVAV